MILVVRLASGSILLAAVILTILLLVKNPLEGWVGLPLGPLATVIAATIASLASLSAVESWNDRRMREARLAVQTQRERVYEEIIVHMCRQAFARPSGETSKAFDEELATRAAAGTWAHPEVLRKMAVWNKTIRDYQGGDDASLKDALCDLVLCMRTDLTMDDKGQMASADEVRQAVVRDLSAKT